MLKLNDTVLYGTTGVCTVESIEKKKIGKDLRDYYVLKPVQQTASTVFLPTDNEILLSKARRILTTKEIEDLFGCLQNEENIWVESDGERKLKYTQIVTSGDRLSFLVLLRTLCSKQRELSEVGKRLHIADEHFLKEVKRLVFDEISVVMNLDLKEVENFVMQKISCK